MIKFALCDDNPQLVSKLQEMLEKIFLKHDFDASVVFSSCDASSLLCFIFRYRFKFFIKWNSAGQRNQKKE